MMNPLDWLRRKPRERKPNGLQGRLTGHFAVLETEIVGWVPAHFRDAKGDLDIRFVLRGQVVQRCKAPAQPEHKRYLFRIPRGPWLHPPDMLDGTLVVEIDSDFGGTGEMLPDGPSQLRAIRDYLDAPEDVALDLAFGRDGNAAAFLGAGWGQQDADAVWSNGTDSVLTFDQPGIEGRFALRFSISPFLAPPGLTRQESNVLMNGEYIGSFALTSGELQSREIRFNGTIMRREPRVTITMQHLFAARPSDFGRPSQELRALRMKRLRLVRIDAASE